mmetsp:Transcript_4706/g.17096  ORF Transcript_4706/g.17096 Transcript_4706/m.17096 type:complete len:86 (-) Transcript_4706:921-1178(-)
MDSQDLHTSSLIWDTDVDFAIEPSKSTESGVDAVGTVGGRHDNDVRTCFQAIHQSKKLRNNASLNFSIDLVTLGCNAINLINEND